MINAIGSPDDYDGTFEQDDVGKIKGDLADYGHITDGELQDAERQLSESIDQRQREQGRYDRGRNGGNRNQQNDHNEYVKHQNRINEEKVLLEQISKRLDEMLRKFQK